MTNRYLFSFWIIALMIAPFIDVLYQLIIGHNDKFSDLVEMYFVIVSFSIVFSLPTLLISYLTHRALDQTEVILLVKKLIILSIAILGMVVTLELIKGSMIPRLKTSYFMSLITSFMILEVRQVVSDRLKAKAL